jgi:hypothetical protein
VGIHFPSVDTGYAVGGVLTGNRSGTIVKTVDAGESWTILPFHPTLDLHTVFFITANTGFIGGTFGLLMKTTDGGINWQYVQNPSSSDIQSIHFPCADTGYAVTDGGGILLTNDQGNTWTADTSGTWNGLNSVFFTTGTTGYTVGYQGTILKKGIDIINSSDGARVPGNLCKVYPNPSNGEITIEVNSNPAGKSILTLFNNLGEKRYSEVIRLKNPHVVNVKNLNPGVYYLQIQFGERMETKKIIIY